MAKSPGSDGRTTAEELGLRAVTREVRRAEIMGRGLKNTHERVVKVTLPRVSILEMEVPDSPIPPKKNRGGRPRKTPAE